MVDQAPLWPGNKRVAIAINVDLEIWSKGRAPDYSVQSSTLKPGTVSHGGIAWSQYGGKTGVWRVLRMLERHGVPATFSVNAKCAEAYPDAIAQIVKSGFDIAGHGYTQDQLLAYMTPEEERRTITTCLDMLEKASGKRPRGWVTPVHAHTEHTVEFLAEDGVLWHNEAADSDQPHRIDVNGRSMVAIPGSDFTDNRVLRTAPQLLLDCYKRTFGYLYSFEPRSYIGLSIHSQFGGRPLMIAVFNELLDYFASFPDVWFASHREIAEFVLEAGIEGPAYSRRFFA
ncbi:MAG: polysaccharide deacetylase family protein [Xanthobacteraceae bacterium]